MYIFERSYPSTVSYLFNDYIYIYVCVCVCMYVCIYVYMYVCMYVSDIMHLVELKCNIFHE
jgi:hypothetical protein